MAILIAIASITLMNTTCYFESDSTRGSAGLPVPFVSQAGTFYCTSACVLAWRLRDGLSSVPQQEIFNFMGGDPSLGVYATHIPYGVNSYTSTPDAYLDYGQGGEYNQYQGQFFSRQVTSVNAGVPVIALFGSNHAVVISGGSWDTSTTGYHEWTSAQYMDPSYGYGAVTPGDLVQLMCPSNYDSCVQVISARASASGNSNYGTYGGSTEATGIMDTGQGGGPDQQHN